MLRTNLATRPFYNARGVRLALGMVVVIAIALTTYNGVRGVAPQFPKRQPAPRG